MTDFKNNPRESFYVSPEDKKRINSVFPSATKQSFYHAITMNFVSLVEREREKDPQLVYKLLGALIANAEGMEKMYLNILGEGKNNEETV